MITTTPRCRNQKVTNHYVNNVLINNLPTNFKTKTKLRRFPISIIYFWYKGVSFGDKTEELFHGRCNTGQRKLLKHSKNPVLNVNVV